MEKMNVTKGVLSALLATVSAKLGILGPLLLALTVVMVVDYITGMMAAKTEGVISSSKGMWGIFKKILYIIVVGVGMLMDWLILQVATQLGVTIPLTTFFGILVALWLIINELISILENLTRIGTPMPEFLVRIVKHFKVVVEAKGDNMTDKIEESKEETK